MIRPGGLTVLAVVNFVFGGVNLLGTVSVLGMLALVGSAMQQLGAHGQESFMPSSLALYADLGERPEQLSARYESAALGHLRLSEVDGLVERLSDALVEARTGDMERRVTTVGPHRDEVVLMISDRDLRTRASQGEQRTVALGLRVASYELLREEKGATPVLVLDDVFSEMDPGRSQRLVDKLPGGQIFVSTAREEEVPLVGTRWNVSEGVVTVREEGS